MSWEVSLKERKQRAQGFPHQVAPGRTEVAARWICCCSSRLLEARAAPAVLLMLLDYEELPAQNRGSEAFERLESTPQLLERARRSHPLKAQWEVLRGEKALRLHRCGSQNDGKHAL